MKRFLILLFVMLPLAGLAQSDTVIAVVTTTTQSIQSTEATSLKAEPARKSRHSLSISAGVWERDYSIADFSNEKHQFGPIFAIEYQYAINDYVAIRVKGFGGGIYREHMNEINRNIGISAGILVIPFGSKFMFYLERLYLAWYYLCHTGFLWVSLCEFG